MATWFECSSCFRAVPTVDNRSELQMYFRSPFSSSLHSESRAISKKNRFRWLSGRGFRKGINYFSGQDVSFVIVLSLILAFVHFQNRILRAVPRSQTFSPVISREGNGFNRSHRMERREPPAYLPLAQHLRSLKPRKPSLQDMAYGSHEASLHDLKPTDIRDLQECSICMDNGNLVLGSKIPSSPEVDLARMLVKLVSFHGIKSMVTFPCVSETLWIFTFVEIMKKIHPSFMHYCGIESDEVVVDMMKFYNQSDLGETEFIVYSPNARGSLPQVDLLFTWKGLERFGFDTLLALFNHAQKTRIRYTIVKNKPGVENAVMVENAGETYSVVRSRNRALNFRGFPFGFGEAKRVIPLPGSQLLFYNTTELRERW